MCLASLLVSRQEVYVVCFGVERPPRSAHAIQKLPAHGRGCQGACSAILLSYLGVRNQKCWQQPGSRPGCMSLPISCTVCALLPAIMCGELARVELVWGAHAPHGRDCCVEQSVSRRELVWCLWRHTVPPPLPPTAAASALHRLFVHYTAAASWQGGCSGREEVAASVWSLTVCECQGQTSQFPQKCIFRESQGGCQTIGF
jgi:hypothetical protein